MQFGNRNVFVTWERGVLRTVTTIKCESVALVRGKRVQKRRTYVESIDSVSLTTKRLLRNAGVLDDLASKYVRAHIDTHLPSNTITVQAVRNDGEHCAWWCDLSGEKHWTKLPSKKLTVVF